MKKKLSITVEESLISKLDNAIKSGIFRNKSHVVEFALNNLLKNDKKSK